MLYKLNAQSIFQPLKISSYGLGVLLIVVIAGLSSWLATLPWFNHLGLSALTLAILIGIVVGNSFFPKVASRMALGVDFSKNILLRLGIILYGFRISFQQINAVGLSGVVIAIVMVMLTFLLAVGLGVYVFKMDKQTAMLIGAGSAICGAAAVMAAEPVVKGQAYKVSVAVATVVVFGTLSMFLYPLFYHYLGITEQTYGIYAGSTIHEVAQVVVAGKNVSDSAAATAVIEKMLRVLLLAPFLVILSVYLGRKQRVANVSKASIVIPWFAVFFVIAAGFNSLFTLPLSLFNQINLFDTWVLTMAMAALGVRTHLGAIRQAGMKPLLLAFIVFLFLIVGGFLINTWVIYLVGMLG